MSDSHYFEVVQLDNGDFALQSRGDSSKHLIKISFSEEAKAFLGEEDVAVARAMIKAAILTVGHLRDDAAKRKNEEQEPKTIH